MPEYRVTWEMDIDADSPREAAEKALAVQRNPESIATIFTVTPRVKTTFVDLNDDDADE